MSTNAYAVGGSLPKPLIGTPAAFSYTETSSSSTSTSFPVSSYSSNGSGKYDPLIAAFKKLTQGSSVHPNVQPHFESSMKTLSAYFDCTSLKNVSLISLENRALASNELDVLGYEVPSRLRYLEAAVMSTASFVYSFVFATAFTIISVTTYIPYLMTEKNAQKLTDLKSKLWLHTVLAAACTGIGLTGAIAPRMGMVANVACLDWMKAMLERNSGSGFAQNILSAYRNNGDELKAVAAECCMNLEYHSTFKKFFEVFDNIPTECFFLDDLISKIQEAAQYLPPDLMRAFGLKLLNNLGDAVGEVKKDYGSKIAFVGNHLVRFANRHDVVIDNIICDFNAIPLVFAVRTKFSETRTRLFGKRASTVEESSSEGASAPTSSSPSGSAFAGPSGEEDYADIYSHSPGAASPVSERGK
jgi:hypothetical protein